MIVYIPMVVFTCLMSYAALHTKKMPRKTCLIISNIIPIAVASLRYNNGTDYIMYARVFNNIRNNTYSITVKSMEIGFYALVRLCTYLTSSYWFLFFLVSLIIVFFYFKGIWQESNNIVLSVLLFFLCGTFFDSFNGLRQYIAAAICFYALKYVFDGDIKKYFICVIIATLFHYSAIVLLLLYFIRKIVINIPKAVVLIVSVVLGGNIIFQLVLKIIGYTRYRYFLNSIEFKVIPTEASILYISIISIIFCIIILFNKTMTERQRIMFNLQVVTEIVVLLSLFIPLISRVEYYFLPIEILIIPEMIKMIKNCQIRRIICFFICLMFFMIVWWHGIINNGWYDALPYNFYFLSPRI